jgi:hypothetical protein
MDRRCATERSRRDPSPRELPLERQAVQQKIFEILCEMLLQAATGADQGSVQ